MFFLQDNDADYRRYNCKSCPFTLYIESFGEKRFIQARGIMAPPQTRALPLEFTCHLSQGKLRLLFHENQKMYMVGHYHAVHKRKTWIPPDPSPQSFYDHNARRKKFHPRHSLSICRHGRNSREFRSARTLGHCKHIYASGTIIMPGSPLQVVRVLSGKEWSGCFHGHGILSRGRCPLHSTTRIRNS